MCIRDRGRGPAGGRVPEQLCSQGLRSQSRWAVDADRHSPGRVSPGRVSLGRSWRLPAWRLPSVSQTLQLRSEHKIRKQDYLCDSAIPEDHPRDLSDVFSVDDLQELLNHTNSLVFESCALTGVGVFETLKAISKQVIARTGQG